MGNTQKIFWGLFYGILFGMLILGLGGRILMRLLSWLSQTPGDFSIRGTLMVMSLGVLIGGPAGLIFPFIRRHLPGPMTFRGALWGMVTFGVLVALPVKGKRAALAFPEYLLLTILLFATLFLIFGVALSAAMARALPPPSNDHRD